MDVMSESPAISESPAYQQLPAGRYRIDVEQSTVSFTTRHFFGLGPVRGTIALRDGMITVGDPVAGSTVRARVAASTFRSGSQPRDAAVLSPRLLDAENYPSLTFTSTDLVRESAAGPAGNPGQWRLRGELEVRGVTRLVEVRIIALSVAEDGPAGPAGPTLRASAQLSVDRYAFGITAYRGLAARMLTIDLDLRAQSVDQRERTGRR